jgi:hypothetical protein
MGICVDADGIVSGMMTYANDVLAIFTPFLTIQGGVGFGAGLAGKVGSMLRNLI